MIVEKHGKTHPVRHRVAVGPLVAGPVDHLVESDLAADPEDDAAECDANSDYWGDDEPRESPDGVEKNGRWGEDQSPDKVAKRAEQVYDQSKHDVRAGEVLEVNAPAREVTADALEVLAVVGTSLGVSATPLTKRRLNCGMPREALLVLDCCMVHFSRAPDEVR